MRSFNFKYLLPCAVAISSARPSDCDVLLHLAQLRRITKVRGWNRNAASLLVIVADALVAKNFHRFININKAVLSLLYRLPPPPSLALLPHHSPRHFHPSLPLFSLKNTFLTVFSSWKYQSHRCLMARGPRLVFSI